MTEYIFLLDYFHVQASNVQVIRTLPLSQSRVSSSNDPGPVYESVDVFQSIQTSSSREEMISMESHKADTIYACPEVTACSGNNTQSISESATMEKAQTSKQIDSVYSMLQN